MESHDFIPELCALLFGEPDATANLANAAAFLYGALPNVNWAGFYLLRGDTLVLAPFCGKPACTRIAAGRGVCGAAVLQKCVLRVPDVHAFPGHIACDCASRSEIVLPLYDASGNVLGVLDIDSALLDRFSEADEALLFSAARVVEKVLWEAKP